MREPRPVSEPSDRREPRRESAKQEKAVENVENLTEALESVKRLTRDQIKAAGFLSKDQVRFLVDAYYTMQKDRIRAANQVRALGEVGEPNEIVDWLSGQSSTLENQIKRALDAFSGGHPQGIWPRSVVGVGPVIAAGLIAHIDIQKAPTVGHIWRFAGLDPTRKWEKKTKRPWNAGLKTLCAFKLGESFVKNQNRVDENGEFTCVYGQLFADRKAREIVRNEAGDHAELCKRRLESERIDKSTELFKHLTAGRLPPAAIHARARRFAVKLFLAHLHEVWFRLEFGREPPLPYPIAHLGHAHKIEPDI